MGSTSDRQQCQKREEERVGLSGAERLRLPNRDLHHVRVFRIEEQVIVAANHHTGHTQHHALAGIVPGIPNDRRLRLLLHKMTAIMKDRDAVGAAIGRHQVSIPIAIQVGGHDGIWVRCSVPHCWNHIGLR